MTKPLSAMFTIWYKKQVQGVYIKRVTIERVAEIKRFEKVLKTNSNVREYTLAWFR